MPSLFHKAAFDRRFQLPFLFFEDIEQAILGLGDDATDQGMVDAIKGSLKRCLGMKSASSDDVAYVSERLERAAQETKEHEEGPPPSKKASFATSFAQWVSKLQPHELCLVLAQYDHQRATHLYSKVDREDVVAMSTQWMHHEWENIKVGYESVVYGFGGGYEGTPVAADVDVSTDSHLEGTVIDSKALAAVKFL